MELLAVPVVEPAPVALLEMAVNLVAVANIRVVVPDPARHVPVVITQVLGLLDAARVLLGSILLVARAVATRAQPAHTQLASLQVLVLVHTPFKQVCRFPKAYNLSYA